MVANHTFKNGTQNQLKKTLMVAIITYNKSTASYLKNFWEYLRLIRIITNVPKCRINVNYKINNYWSVQQLYVQDIWIQV